MNLIEWLHDLEACGSPADLASAYLALLSEREMLQTERDVIVAERDTVVAEWDVAGEIHLP